MDVKTKNLLATNMDVAISVISQFIRGFVPSQFSQYEDVIVLASVISITVILYIIIEKIISAWIRFMFSVLSTFFQMARWVVIVYLIYLWIGPYLSKNHVEIPTPISNGFNRIYNTLWQWTSSFNTMGTIATGYGYLSNAYSWVLNKTIGS